MTICLKRREALLAGLAAASAYCLPQSASAAGKLPATITDGQAHIWERGGKKQPSKSGRQVPFSPEQLIADLDSANVKRAILVPPSWAAHGDSYSLKAAETYPDRFKVMGLLSFPKPEDRDKIEHWLDTPGMAGASMFMDFPKGAEWLDAGKGDWLWPILEDKKIPLTIHAGLALPTMMQVAAKHPGLKLCLDSFGLSTKPHGAAAVEAFDKVAPIARLPNVTIKVGTVSFLTAEPAPFKDMQTLVHKAYDAFGPERMFFASDITLINVPYAQEVDWWANLDFMSDQDRALIMGENISKWLGWAETA